MDSLFSDKQSPINIIREVFGYIHRFKNEVFVLKIEDDLLTTPLFPILVKDIVLIKNMGIKVILVPGAKTSIDQVLTTYKEPILSENNIRITTDKAMPLVKLGASNVTNKMLTLLSENGAHGVSGNWVKAHAIGIIEGLDFQNTGCVESIKTSVIDNLLINNLIPIIPNIGWNAIGKPYNISSNELAVTIASSMKASKLFFISKKKGIAAIPHCKVANLEVRTCGVFSSIELSLAERLVQLHSHELDSYSSEIITHAIKACKMGVNRVHVIDGSYDGILLQEIFSTTGQGTMFHGNVHKHIRKAQPEDISEILHVMNPYVKKGVLIQRTAEEIGEKLSSYYVYHVDDALHGCGAITFHPGSSAEIEAIVVDPHYSGKGTGKKIIRFLMGKARKQYKKSIFILTTQSGDYFMNLGFTLGSMDDLPEERKKTYNPQRKSKILTINL